jgi:hypothetical protein
MVLGLVDLYHPPRLRAWIFTAPICTWRNQAEATAGQPGKAIGFEETYVGLALSYEGGYHPLADFGLGRGLDVLGKYIHGCYTETVESIWNELNFMSPLPSP